MTDTTKPLTAEEREELRAAWTRKMHGLSGPFPGLRLLADHDRLAAEVERLRAAATADWERCFGRIAAKEEERDAAFQARDAAIAAREQAEATIAEMQRIATWLPDDGRRALTDDELRGIKSRWATGPERYQQDADALICGIAHERAAREQAEKRAADAEAGYRLVQEARDGAERNDACTRAETSAGLLREMAVGLGVPEEWRARVRAALGEG